uniref:inter-alpha-trypsin inhibitor isoform X2 n=1 Tax=Monopterus albus TaxID=43700 RepID=UPI0009B4D6CF|nr:inter-alpha-trypsin inhibitor-like isoform X2 [Monopterus albus]
MCQSKDFCHLPQNEGDGEGFTFSFYYNATKDRCNPFIYKGRGGNANRFANEKQCIRNCSANAEKIYPMDESQACHFKKAIGECNGNAVKFFYDPIHQKCITFLWSGCIGNGNRFDSYRICNTTCFGIRDDGDAEEETEHDTPVAIICGVLLAVIITAILITVIVFIVKSKKKGSKKKAPGKSKEAQSELPLQEQGTEIS